MSKVVNTINVFLQTDYNGSVVKTIAKIMLSFKTVGAELIVILPRSKFQVAVYPVKQINVFELPH